MKKYIFILLLITTVSACTKEQDKNAIPLNIIRNKSHVTVKVGEIVIPDILLDTGFPSCAAVLFIDIDLKSF